MAAGAAAAVAPAILRGADLAKEPVRLGHIGTGTRGWDLVKYTGAVPEAKVLAVCDVYGPHRKRGMEASGNAEVKGYTTSIASAKRMRAAVKKANAVFQLGHQGRQLPATALMSVESYKLRREVRWDPDKEEIA